MLHGLVQPPGGDADVGQLLLQADEVRGRGIRALGQVGDDEELQTSRRDVAGRHRVAGCVDGGRGGELQLARRAPVPSPFGGRDAGSLRDEGVQAPSHAGTQPGLHGVAEERVADDVPLGRRHQQLEVDQPVQRGEHRGRVLHLDPVVGGLARGHERAEQGRPHRTVQQGDQVQHVLVAGAGGLHRAHQQGGLLGPVLGGAVMGRYELQALGRDGDLSRVAPVVDGREHPAREPFAACEELVEQARARGSAQLRGGQLLERSGCEG